MSPIANQAGAADFACGWEMTMAHFPLFIEISAYFRDAQMPCVESGLRMLSPLSCALMRIYVCMHLSKKSPCCSPFVKAGAVLCHSMLSLVGCRPSNSWNSHCTCHAATQTHHSVLSCACCCTLAYWIVGANFYIPCFFLLMCLLWVRPPFSNFSTHTPDFMFWSKSLNFFPFLNVKASSTLP